MKIVWAWSCVPESRDFAAPQDLKSAEKVNESGGTSCRLMAV